MQPQGCSLCCFLTLNFKFCRFTVLGWKTAPLVLSWTCEVEFDVRVCSALVARLRACAHAFHTAPATQAVLLNLLASLDIYLEAHIGTGLQTSVQITSGAIQLRPSFQLCDVSVANVQARVLAPHPEVPDQAVQQMPCDRLCRRTSPRGRQWCRAWVRCSTRPRLLCPAEPALQMRTMPGLRAICSRGVRSQEQGATRNCICGVIEACGGFECNMILWSCRGPLGAPDLPTKITRAGTFLIGSKSHNCTGACRWVQF